MLTLYDWQEADVQEALSHDSWLLAYEMGLGKTLVSVEWAKRKGDIDTIIVVAPLNTFRSWKRTVEQQWPDMPVYYLKTDNKNIANFDKLKRGVRGVYLIGWELMRSGAITGQRADLGIADETHKQANYGRSLQSKLMREWDSKYKLALSGTPAANKPDGIFATINWLWPKRYPSLWRWVEDFWRTRRNGAVIDLVRELTPGGVIADLPMFTRRLKKDHRNDLPGNLPEIEIEVELSPMQAKVYQRLAEEAGVWLEDEFISTAIPLVEDMRLGQITLGVPKVDKETGKVTFAENCGSSKIAALKEVLEDNEGAFLVLTHSKQFIPSVVHQLNKAGFNARGFTGDTKQDERDWLIDNIGVGYRVLVAGIQAIGEGTDGLQYHCNNGFWLSKHPDWKLNKQAKERLDRPGQQEPINWWYTVAPNTVDEKRRDRLEEIEGNLEEMLDNYPVN